MWPTDVRPRSLDARPYCLFPPARPLPFSALGPPAPSERAKFPDLARKDNDYVRAARQLIEADDARSAELERRRQDCSYYGVCDRSEARSELESEAWHKLIRMPAPDGRALMWKMQELWGDDDGDGYSDGWTMDIVELVLADARRLLSA